MSDSMANGRFGISDYDQLEDESFPPLPPPHSPGHGADDENPFGEEDGDLSKLADVPAAKRKVVRKPQPKLDSQRLISERGLPALRTLFNNVHFKGKGHEAEDLCVIMQKMENWAHRLYPKLQFDDFMDKVERLGSKKDVQTCLKRIRLDLPLIHDDFISKDVEEEMTPVQQIFGDPDPFGSPRGFPGNSQGPVHSTPAPAHSAPAPAHSTPALTLTEEQRRRIELNKQLALEKRLARQQQPIVLDIVPDPQVVSSQAVSPQADSSKADSSKADSSQADSSKAVPSQADSSQADSSQAVPSKAVPSQADSSQADSSQADSSKAVPSQADSSKAVPSQADSSKAVSSQADSSQADSSKAVSSQADSSHDVPSQADSSQVISSQASPVHQPPASLPQSEPCPPEPGLEDMDMDMDVDPSTEHPDNATARDSPASLASPKHKEGELSQPGS